VRCLTPSLFVVFALSCSASAQLEFRKLDEPIIQARLESFSKKNDEREAQLKKLFVESGCDANHLSEQLVKKKLAPNLICVLPGQTDDVILVGGHFDKVNVGEGVVDNWSGASLLLGLGPTKIWATHADPPMLFAIAAIAQAMKLPIGVVNVDQVGLTDSESFAKYKVPRITIHSITQETWPILHTDKDKLSAIKMDDYYATYRLLGGYLSYLDTYLGSKAAQPAPAKPPAQ